MRKILKFTYLLISAVAISAPACTRWQVEDPENPIRFSPVASKSTRAIISGTTYPASESFVVSAYTNGTNAYFEDLTAFYSSELTLWETSSSQYWPLGGSLTFNAFSPESVASSGVSVDETGVSADDYTIQNTTQMTTDLCYASATVADCSLHPDAVAINFSHALSQVVFRVKAADYYTNTVLSMTSLSMEGIYSVGDLADSTWTNQDVEHTYTLSSSSTALTYDAHDDPETIDICAYLFIPQELGANAALNVGYSIAQTVNATPYTLNNPPVSVPLGGTIDEWEPGHKYIYTISIGLDNVITFTATAADWQTGGGGVVVE